MDATIPTLRVSSPAAARGAASFAGLADLDEESARRVAALALAARPAWPWLAAGVAVLWVVLVTLGAPSVVSQPNDATRLTFAAFALGVLPPVVGYVRAWRRFAAGCRELGLGAAAIKDARARCEAAERASRPDGRGARAALYVEAIARARRRSST